MDVGSLIQAGGCLWSPLSFALLVGLAVVLVSQAFAPARPQRQVEERLDDYLDRGDVIEAEDMSQPFARRALLPLLRSLLRILGRLAPKSSVEKTQQMLIQAGHPLGLTVLDFFGLRLLVVLLFAGGYYYLHGQSVPLIEALRNMLLVAVFAYLLPSYWLRLRVRRRQKEITRALPDALDMMTVGVEAGLAFETALLKVGERWDNALTRELRRTVAEMRVGTSREVALRRMVERTGVDDLATFVAVLVQSSQLGVSIATVLHTQAAQMRMRRRQRAEELARQAGIKMIFPLALLIFPALLVVILGPSIPAFQQFFSAIGGGPALP
jgi:tight adherence protein C